MQCKRCKIVPSLNDVNFNYKHQLCYKCDCYITRLKVRRGLTWKQVDEILYTRGII